MKTLLQLAPISAQTDTDPGPDWRTRAACRETPKPDDFYPHPSDEAGADRVALEYCARCPVTLECLESALAAEGCRTDRHGIWGGRTPAERERISRRRAKWEAELAQLDNGENPVELEHNKKAAPAGYRGLTAKTAKES